MSEDELVAKLYTAFELICKLAHASELILDRVAALEAREAERTAAEAITRAMG